MAETTRASFRVRESRRCPASKFERLGRDERASLRAAPADSGGTADSGRCQDNHARPGAPRELSKRVSPSSANPGALRIFSESARDRRNYRPQGADPRRRSLSPIGGRRPPETPPRQAPAINFFRGPMISSRIGVAGSKTARTAGIRGLPPTIPRSQYPAPPAQLNDLRAGASNDFL